MTPQNERLLIFTGLGAAALFVMFPGFFARLLAKTAVTTGVEAGKVVVQTAEGAVIGIGEAVGIPQTDADQCAAYVAAGDWWNASFYCPAGTFLKSAAGAVYNTATGSIIGYSTPTAQNEVISIETAGYDYSPDDYAPFVDLTNYGTDWDTAA